jgi:enoyl-CoA hydratase
VARQLARVDRPLMRQTKQAINRAYAIMGMDQALAEALEIDTRIEGEGMPSKTAFLDIARKEGLRAAIAWRDGRFAEDCDPS